MTEKEIAFKEKLHSLYSLSVVPAIYLYPDGSVFYANKICMLLYGTDFIVKGFASIVSGDWNLIVSKALEDMLPCEITFKNGNYFIDGILSPFEECGGNVYLSVKTGKTSTPDQPLECAFIFDTAQSAFRTYIEDTADEVDMHIGELGRLIGEDDRYFRSLRKLFDGIRQTSYPLKDMLYVMEKLNNVEREAFCLKDTVADIARLTGAIRIMPSNTIGVDHIITRGNPALIAAAFTDIVTKLLPYSPGQKVCVTVTVEQGDAAVRFNSPDPDARPHGRYIYTLDGDIYNENHEIAYRLIKSDGGKMTTRLSPMGLDTVCLFPLEKFSLRYSLSSRKKITDRMVVVNAIRALKLLKMKLRGK